MKKALSFLIALALILSSFYALTTIEAVAATIPGNLIVNGDFEETDAQGLFPSPFAASPVWSTSNAFQKWFRTTPGSGTDVSTIITDPGNSNNKIAKAMQNAAQGVTVEAGKTYVLTFSAKADYAFKEFRVSFFNVATADRSSAYEVLYPIVESSGTKTYLNGSMPVTENFTTGYRPYHCLQMQLDTTKWVTYKVQLRIDPAWAPSNLGAIVFAANDYSDTVGAASHAAFYLDNVSLQESYRIVSNVENLSGKTGGYISNDDTIHAVSGENVTLKAVAYSGSTFDGWYLNGTKVSTSAQYTFSASADATYLAKFNNPQQVYVPDSNITSDEIIASDPNLMISYPHYGTPAFTEPDGQITAEVRAPSTYGTSGWTAWVENDYQKWDCTVGTVTYGASNVYLGLKAGYKIPITLPANVSPELCSLVLKHSSGLTLRSPMSVNIVPNLNASFYTMSLTDTHLGWNNDVISKTGDGCPSAWGLMCKALKDTGIRFLSHTGDIDLYLLQSRAEGIKTMIIDKQLEYSGSTLPFVDTAGNHEYDSWVNPAPSITTGTYYDANSNGVQDPGEFDGTGQFGGTDNDRYFGMRSALMPMGSFLLAKNDFMGNPKLAYYGDDTLRNAMSTAWNAEASKYNYRLLLEHTHNSVGSLFQPETDRTLPAPNPNLELKGHDHQWTVNQNSPYRVLSLGGGAWAAGTGGLIKYDYSNGSWSSPAATTWTTNDRITMVANYTARTTKIDENFLIPNDGASAFNRCTINNAINFNFYDGRVRFVLQKGDYQVTNGTKLSQYDSADGTKTIVLAKVNIPASGSITVSVNHDGSPIVANTVTFHPQGGTAVNAKAAETGGSITEPVAPTRTGYNFVGWFDQATGGTAITFPYTVTKDVTLYAHWTMGQVTNNMLNNGNFETPTGVNSNGETNLNYINGAYAGTLPTDPKFTKWYRVGDGNTDYHNSIQPDVGDESNHVGKIAQTLMQGGFTLENSKTYNLSFRAKASAVSGTAKTPYVSIALFDATTGITSGLANAIALQTDSIATSVSDWSAHPAIRNITLGGTSPKNFLSAPLYQDGWYTYNIDLTLADNAITSGHSYGLVFGNDSSYSASWYYMYLDDIVLTKEVSEDVMYNVGATAGTGGTASVTESYVTGGTNVTFIATPDSGYSFQGWYKNDVLYKSTPTFSEIIAADTSYEARFIWGSIINYTVGFDSQGGSTITAQTVASGATASAPAPTTKSGYTFDGWYTAASGGTEVTFPYTVNGNVTFYAHWTAIVTYTVAFDSQGGSTVGSQTGTSISAPATPTKSGFTFDGWYTAATGGSKITFPYSATADVTLYAHWTVAQSVTNLLQNGNFETPTGVNDSDKGEINSNYISGCYAATTVTDPKFIKWFRVGDGNKDYHDSIQPEDGNVTNHVGKVAQTLLQGGIALESGKTYDISFRAKASTVSGTSITQHVGVALYDATTNITSGTSAALALKSDSIVTSIVNSANQPAAGGVTVVGTAPNNYMFAPLYQDGWYTYHIKFTLADNAIVSGHSYGMVFSTDSQYSASWYYMYIDDVSLAAQGTQTVNYTTDFDSQGGTAVTAQTVAAGTAITAPTVPTKSNYTFDGWYTAATGGTKITFPYTVTADVTLYAHWIGNTYYVTFNSPGGEQPPISVVYPGTINPPSITKTGYTLAGWYTTPAGGTKVTFPYTPTADVAFYAQWIPNVYTVTFSPEGGSAVPNKTATYNTTIATPADSTKTGYTFAGWFTAATGGTKITFPYTVTADVTLYAQWTPISTTHTPGDISNDELVDLVDITILSRYVASWTGLTYNADALDVNGDGNVDLLDVTMLSRFVAGWPVTIQ